MAREMPSDGQIAAMRCERSAENARAIATVAGVARFFGLYPSDGMYVPPASPASPLSLQACIPWPDAHYATQPQLACRAWTRLPIDGGDPAGELVSVASRLLYRRCLTPLEH